ncbi:acyl-CoA carboxylase subunit beta [Treponema parvum]|uniref:Acyl-CoA carboxylase subunit beta n=1 Tax=Treponema parvum TaxID=138851 RepID=A0A975F378_9SPIR|nr:acyl-CoA carboxylase subunit beta [Treponema parvum]QTQ13523.1 acyl-CoA carboxylase subunit beta [Treponema parvum]
MKYNIEKQHEKGKLHAIERINAICDKDSFKEIYSGVRHNCTSFGMENKDIPYDGVITGFGKINGRKVALYAQDFTVQGGSLGLKHGQKIAELIDMAIEARCPVIGINDSGGARIQEGVDALCGYGDLFYQNVRASGSIPQISIVAGPCAGGAVYSPGITDFIFTVDKVSQLFITGPKVVKSVMFLDISTEDLGGAAIHSKKSGVAHFRCENENDCYARVRQLLDYIPHYYGDKLKSDEKPKYNAKRMQKQITEILPDNSKKGYDIREVIKCVVDEDTFFEVMEEFAANASVGFGKIEGRTVGIVANNPAGLGGVLNCDASDKIARFVRYCDSFNIPLLTFVDVPGFIPGPEEEQKGIIRHGAKVIFAYSEASVPKVTVITRKAYGGAYIAMCSKHLGADFVYAWPTSEIAVMGAEGALGILYAKEMSDPAKAAFVAEKSQEYKDTIMTPTIAAQRGYISEVINPEETRSRVAESFAVLENKTAMDHPLKKHGNIPL